MSFIREKKKKNGTVYKELVESYWDKEKNGPRQRVIKYLGVVSEENGKEKLLPVSHKMDTIEQSVKIGELSLYYAAMCEIGLIDVLKKVFFTSYYSIIGLIMNQLCKRKSLEKAANWINNTPMMLWIGLKEKKLCRNDLDRALEELCFIKDGAKVDNGLRIQQEMTEICQSKYSSGRNYLYYDITKITYYGYKCDYSEKSYNPGNRGKHAIGLGFVTLRDTGFPVRCMAIPGSKNDTITMEDMIFSLKNCDYKGIPMVVDRGMMSAKNINMARDNDFHVIGCCPDGSKEYDSAITLWNDDDICKWNAVVERPSGEVVYLKGRKGEMYGQKGLIVVVLDPAWKTLEKSNRDLMIKQLNETSDKNVIKDLKKALAPIIKKSKGRRGFKIDTNLVEKEEKKDGRFLMFCTDRRLSAKKVFEVYFQRDEIEKTFKCLKGEISLGPIRFQRPVRIDAYLTVVFLAYLIRTVVKHQLKKRKKNMSVEEAISEIKSISLIEYTYKNKVKRKITRFTQKQEDLIKLLKIDKFIHSAENS